MALAKLWNAVFGKRSATEVPTPPAEGPKSITLMNSPNSAIPRANEKWEPASTPAVPPVIKLSRKKAKASKPKTETVVPVAAELSVQPTVRMFKRKTNAWSKLIGNHTVSTVLDLNIGDGNRAVEILEAIVDATNTAPKLIAISMFEMAGSGISVRQFHQRIRAAGGQPIAIPMSLPDGLRRLSETVGSVDLVVFDGDADTLASPMVGKLLNRLTNRDALVLRKDSAGRWQANTALSSNRPRQAA